MHAHIDAHSHILIDEYPGYGIQSTSRLQSQWENIKFYNQIRYNRLFQQVIYKVGESGINYIKIFQNAKAISVGNSYSKDQLMQTFLENFQQYGK